MSERGDSQNTSWRIQSGSDERSTVVNVESESYHFLKPYTIEDTVSMVNEPELVYGTIKPIVQYLGYSQQELARVLEVDPSTLFRWNKGDKSIGKMRSKTMYDIDHIIARGIQVFGSEEQLKEWLNTANEALGNQKPIELMKGPYGLERVEQAMEALEWGNIL